MTFKPVAFLKCVASEHLFKNSRAKPGYVTCQRCGFRKRN